MEKRNKHIKHVTKVSSLLFTIQTNHDINAGKPVMNINQHIVFTIGFS